MRLLCILLMLIHVRLLVLQNIRRIWLASFLFQNAQRLDETCFTFLYFRLVDLLIRLMCFLKVYHLFFLFGLAHALFYSLLTLLKADGLIFFCGFTVRYLIRMCLFFSHARGALRSCLHLFRKFTITHIIFQVMLLIIWEWWWWLMGIALSVGLCHWRQSLHRKTRFAQ